MINDLHVLYTIGLFVAFFLAVILPIRRLAKRKGSQTRTIYDLQKNGLMTLAIHFGKKILEGSPSKEW